MKVYPPRILLVIIVVLAYTPLRSQFNNHWHFGSGVGIDFSSGTPMIEPSSVSASSIVEASSISNPDGDLIVYADGENVYNADGLLVENGDFDSDSRENIFSPIPGSPEKFYLFRSNDNIGVTWSIVDMSLNSGQGGILPDEKEIEIYSQFSQLMVTTNANQTDFWLIIANNLGDNFDDILVMTSFSITSSGLNDVSELSSTFIFANWFDFIDDARMSPTCVNFVTLHKGHYLTLFEFDNVSGVITMGFTNSGNVSSSFFTTDYCEYSGSGEYIYVLKDNTEVWRFDATTLNYVDFENSGEQIAVNEEGSWQHIKRSPSDEIYLLNSNGSIDGIVDADEVSPIVALDLLDLGNLQASFFPNTMNSCLSQEYIIANSVCVGDSMSFLASFSVPPDSLYWTIQGTTVDETVYSIYSFNLLLLDTEEYDVVMHYQIEGVWFELEESPSVFAQPVVQLPEDMTTCDGEVVQLTVGETPYDVLWSNGATEPFIEVVSSGVYSVQMVNGACIATDEIVIDFILEPQLLLDDIVICNEQIDVVLDATNPHADSYLWNDSSTQPQLVVSTSGVYEVVLSNDCFSITDQALVTYVQFPDQLVADYYSSCGDSLLIQSAYNAGNILWSNGNSGSQATIFQAGSYSVTIDELGCIMQDVFDVDFVEYIDANLLLVPNVISANQDNVNDVFRVFNPLDPSNNVCEYVTLSSEMLIYNRWGTELYSGGCAWDGILDSGKEISEGTYFYIVDVSSQCDVHESNNKIAGSFHVLR